MLRISLLGGFLIEHEGRSLPPIASSAGRSLLAYLITYRERQHTRDLLAGTFWPDRSEASARKRLSQALWQIHTAFRSAGAEESIISVTPSQVAFNSKPDQCWLDIEEFERLSNADRTKASKAAGDVDTLEQAVALYRGDFLAGFYDDWMLLERERLRDAYLQALERLVALHKARSDYRAGLSFARRIVLEDPVRESAHREVMRLNFLLGRSTEALRQYERCEDILREELSVEPSTATRRLRAELIQLRDKGDRPFIPAIDAPLIGDPRKVPLVGRSAERTAVVRCIEETLVGKGGVVLIEGESGIGKTRLLNELIEDAHWRGVSVLWVRADHQTQLHPYHTISEAFHSGINQLRARQLAEILDESHLMGLERVAPEIGEFTDPTHKDWGLPPEEARRHIRRSLRKALVALGELGAHALIIDDAHHADPESLEVLDELLGETTTPLLVVLAHRSDETRNHPEIWRILRRIDEHSHPNRVALNRLNPEETNHLIAEATGAVISPSIAEGIFHETGGNPLFILETLHTMHEAASKVLEDPIGQELVPTEEVAKGISRVIKRRLSNLDPEARVVLNAAATLGSRMDVDLLTRMSRLETSATLQGLSQLVQRGVLVELDDGYDFSHQQMRLVANKSIRSNIRRRLHREAALALEAEHPNRIEDLAHHYSEAGMAEQAMHLAWQAGSRAVTLASYEAAVRFLNQAVEWAKEVDLPVTDHFELLADLESALDVLGERDEQLAYINLMESVGSEDRAMLAEAQRRRANLFAQRGSYGEALEMAELARLSATESDQQEVIGAVERTIGTVHSLAGDPTAALPRLKSAVALIAGRTAEEADVRRSLGDVLADLQRYEESSEELSKALTLYEESGNLRGVADVKGLLGILAMEQGHGTTAENLYQQALDLAKRIGYRRAEAANRGNLANLRYLAGRIDEALDQMIKAAETFVTIGDRRSAALAYANAASVRHLVLGDDERAASEAQSALNFFEEESHDWGMAFCLEILAGVHEWSGDISSARELLTQGLSLVAGNQHRWLEVHLLRHLAEIENVEGRVTPGRELITRATSLCRELGLSDVIPTVEAVASQAALAEGDLDQATLLARNATATLTETTEQPYRVWYQRYVVESAAGNQEESQLALAEASRLLDETLAQLSPDVRHQALSRVPVNRAIASSRQRFFPEEVDVRLPRDDVPLGRRLREDDTAEIRWTISDPSDFEILNPIARRRHRICRLVDEARVKGATPRVADLALALGISNATLRRDLAALRHQGTFVATRGRQP